MWRQSWLAQRSQGGEFLSEDWGGATIGLPGSIVVVLLGEDCCVSRVAAPERSGGAKASKRSRLLSSSLVYAHAALSHGLGVPRSVNLPLRQPVERLMGVEPVIIRKPLFQQQLQFMYRPRRLQIHPLVIHSMQ
jgi:hypothetical protein